jgi:hypothetical protein
MDGVTNYPLAWPAGWKRTSQAARVRPQFGTKAPGEWKRDITVIQAVERLSDELARLGAATYLVSTNLRTRQDGLPRSDQGTPADPGAACYFTLRKQQRCLACDRYVTVAGNIAAIAAHVAALRAIERYGVGTLDQAFAGYTALPPAADAWWLVFNLPQTATLDQVDERFRELAKAAHPDAGGSHNDMARLTAAREAARKALR